MDDIQKDIAFIRNRLSKEFKAMTVEERDIFLQEIVRKKNRNKLAQILSFKGDSFDARVFELIYKAQTTPENYFRLRLGFPDHVELWEEWQATENEGDFFKKYS